MAFYVFKFGHLVVENQIESFCFPLWYYLLTIKYDLVSFFKMTLIGIHDPENTETLLLQEAT